MLIVVVFFLFIILAIITGLVSPTIREFKNARVNLDSKQSYFLAESGIEDAMFRIIKGKTIGSSEVLTLGANTATTEIATTGGNIKSISTVGDVLNYQRKINLSLTTGAGVAFNYGLQSGTGGVIMDGGSQVNGNIYSNGNINATGGVDITGTAVAASNATLVLDQGNETPIPPSSSINFRNLSASQDFAQSFQVSSSSPIYKIQFYIKKVGSPSDATVRLVTNNSGSPSTTPVNIGTVSLSGGQVTSNYGWLDVILPTQPSLTPGTTYWIIIDNNTQNASNYYIIGANNTYSAGAAKVGKYSGAWTATNLDGYFRLYTMQGVTSLIGGATYVGGVQIGDSGVGDAWATVVKGASVAGQLYCQVGYFNNKTCDTSRGAPPPVPLPYSDANIQSWKDEGAAGGIITGATKCHGGYANGDCHVDWADGTFGPGQITGNLLVDGGGTLTLTGTVWVQGTITVTGGGEIRLPANFSQNSATLISDKQVLLGGGSYSGSGAPGSYLFVVSTSECPDYASCPIIDSNDNRAAIIVSGGSGTIAVNAQSGMVSLLGGIHINAAVGETIRITGGSEVTYDQGLASPSFQNGPSGAWVVDSWGEGQ